MAIRTILIDGGNGIRITKECDSSADYPSIPNSTRFKDKSDGLIYFKDLIGDIWDPHTGNITSPNVTSGNILYVAVTGSDADTTRAGHIGKRGNPFLTLDAAAAVAIPGDLIYVLSGTYLVTTTSANGISKDGCNYYFEAGCYVSKATVGPIFSSTGFSIGCSVFGHADFDKNTTGGIIFEQVNTNATFNFNKCTSSTDVCIQNISGYYLFTNGLSCVSTGSSAMWLGWGAGGHTLANIALIKSTATTAIRCWGSDATGSNYVINASRVESTSGVGIHATCGVFNVSYCTGSTYGYQLGYYGGWVVINGNSNSIYMSTLTLTLNGRTTYLTCAGGNVTGGMCDNVNISGGNVETTVGDYFPTIIISGGVSILTVKAVGINMTISGGILTIAKSLSVVTGLIYNTGQTITAGRLNILCDLYYGDTEQAIVLSGTGVINLVGSISMLGTNRIYRNCGIRYQGGKVLLNGSTIYVTDSNCLPIAVETTNRNVQVKSTGFNTNSVLGFLDAKKQKLQMTITAVATSTIQINATTASESDTTTYNTTALLAQRMVALINANVSLNTVVIAAYVSANVFTIEALVASVAYTQSNLVNITSIYVMENSYGLTNTTGGPIMEDIDTEI